MKRKDETQETDAENECAEIGKTVTRNCWGTNF